jgi:hypothetical protein
MKTSKVLKLARPLIKDYEFLCRAVDSTRCRDSNVTIEDVIRVQAMISKRLDGYFTLDSWLLYVHGVLAKDMDDNKYEKKMLQTRLAWCDSMIAEFAAKGD